MKIIKLPFAFLAFLFKAAGIIFCLCVIGISNVLVKRKRSEKPLQPKLDIDFVQLPELGKKLQQSFK